MTGRAVHRVAVLSPRGRDAEVIGKVLLKSGIEAGISLDFAAWTRALAAADSALVTEEAMACVDTAFLFDWLDRQPAWSDYPFIVLATRQPGHRTREAARTLERLGNVVLLERPVNAETLTSAVTSALRSRRRQYQARTYLAELEAAKETLRTANENLEAHVSRRTREVEAARETLAFALDSAEMGTWDLDLVKDQTRRSRGHDVIFGYDRSPGAWGSQDFLNHVVAEDREAVREKMDAALRTGLLDLACRIMRPNGAVRWIAVKGRVDYDEQGTPVRMAGIVRDRTDQHATEEALRHAQKMEAIGQLTGGVAHDFNNLLTVIVGGLDMMIRRPEQAERVRRLAQAAMNAAQRGEQLTQQLLAFSRRQMLRPQTLNPNRLLLEFKPLADRAAGQAIALDFNLDPGIDPIRVDPAQFESAVLNLIVNARDAMDNGTRGARIVVESRNVRLSTADVLTWGIAPGAYVLVSVKDEGSGIAPETIARIFEPFFTTKEVGKGSGLGLAQVYGFIRSAGGYAAIDSTVGSGTTINLYFPRSSGTVDAGTGLSPVGAIPLRRANTGETVLLVEDDEEVLGMAVESLEELRYRVIVARDAREALQHLNGLDRIDILFSDVVMPGGMNGAQLANEARRVRPGLKVLLTSGYVADLDEGQTVARGELPVLNKPYRRDELARTLRLVLASE
jgi:signal transduction histidine kinase